MIAHAATAQFGIDGTSRRIPPGDQPFRDAQVKTVGEIVVVALDECSIGAILRRCLRMRAKKRTYDDDRAAKGDSMLHGNLVRHAPSQVGAR